MEAQARTYQYLRVGIVALILVLACSLAIELHEPTGPVCRGLAECGSISAFFYTPVRTVFVGGLIATGLALIVLRGRPGWEDALLNVAGMLAVGVAIVPTPLAVAVVSRVDGTQPPTPTVPVEFQPGVANNVLAFAVVGLLGVVTAAVLAYRSRELTRANVTAITVTGLLVVGYLAWHQWWLTGFLRWAHYAAAIPMFLVMTIVVEINARDVPRDRTRPLLSDRQYTRAYRTIALTMVLVLVLAVVLAWAQAHQHAVPAGWLFWVEAVLIALFSLFWILQTVDYATVGRVPARPGLTS